MAADKEATYTWKEMPYIGTYKEATYTGKEMPYMQGTRKPLTLERRCLI